jgi:integrase
MFELTSNPKKPKGEYPATTNRLIAQFGSTRLVRDLAASDFEALREVLAKQYGPVRRGNEIQRVRTVFKYAFEAGLIDTPIRFGPQFKKPSEGVMRRHRAKNGAKMLEADELRRILDVLAGKEVGTNRISEENGKPVTVTLAPNPVLRAMVLLGINCGFGNHNIATLPLSAVNFDSAWVNYPRPKTGIPRRCPLWPETVVALREAIAVRPEPRQEEAKGLVFVTSRGRPWLSLGIANPVSIAIRDLMKAVGVHRDGIGFYTLRHVFRTVADAARDSVAIDLIMGHSDPTMGGHYRERVDDSRLLAVSEHVRHWLFAGTPANTTKAAGSTSKSKKRRELEAKPHTRPTLRLYAG